MGKAILIAAVFVVAGLAGYRVFIFLRKGEWQDQPPPVAAERPVVRPAVTEPITPANELLAAYKADKVKSAGYYGDRALRVQLRIDMIDVGGGMLTISQQEGDGRIPPSVSCWLPNSASSKVEVGKTVVVRGQVISYIDIAGSEHLSLGKVTLE